MKKPYIKPEFTVVEPGSPKYEEILELIKSQQSTNGADNQ